MRLGKKIESKRSKIANKLTRRDFLKSSVVAVASAAWAMPVIVPSSARGANAPSNRITIGCIGMRNMGTTNMKGFMAKPAAQVVAVCDVDTVYREEARNIAGLEPKSAYNDFRELLVREDIDAVMVATPDHWHVPISIAATKAGKDIYIVKNRSLAP